MALPAATAAITYLDARLSLSHDVGLLSTLLGGRIGQAIVDKRDRWNAFYLLEERAQSPTYCNQSFIVHRDREWSYSQTYEKVLRYGAWLKQRYGVRRNEIVAMDFMNSDTFIFLWFGLWAIGARPAFINYNLQGKALEHCLRASTARLLFVDPDIRPSISDEVLTSIAQADFRSGDSTGPVEVVVVTPDVEAEIDNVEPERSPDGDRAGARRSDMAILIYTSGTTGLPKPAIVSWLKASFAPRSFARLLRLRKTDRIYTVSIVCTGAAVRVRAKCTSPVHAALPLVSRADCSRCRIARRVCDLHRP